MSHTTSRRALAAAATALLALAPSALAADRAPHPGPTNDPRAVAAQPGPRTHAQTPSDINRAFHATVGVYTPGSIPALSYPSGGSYTPGAIPAVSYPEPVTAARAVQAPDDSGGVSATTIGLGIAGSLLAISAIAGMTLRTRRTERARITA